MVKEEYMKLEEALSPEFTQYIRDNYPEELKAGINCIVKKEMDMFKGIVKNIIKDSFDKLGKEVFDICPLIVMKKVGYKFKITDSNLGRDIIVPDDYDYDEIEVIINDDNFTVDILRKADRMKRMFGGKIV